MMPRTLRGLIALTGLAIGVLTIALGSATYYFANTSLVDELNTRIAVESRALVAIGGQGGIDAVAAAVRAREAAPSVGNLGYIVIDGHGRHVAGALRAAIPPAGYWDCMDYVRSDGRRSVAQSLNSPLPGGGRLIVAVDRTIVNEADGTVVILFGTAFGMILLFGFGGAWLVGRIVRGRLDRMATTAEAIMAGDLSRRMPLTGEHGEFDQLSTVINRMLDRIEVLLENLRRISTGVAHDIRSPLNRARGRLEALEASLGDRPQRDEVSASIGDLDDVLDLLRALLGISEIEGFAVRKRFVRLDLGALVEDVADGYRPVVEGAGLTIATDVASLAVAGDPALLRRALANLIDNTILYTPPGTHILVCTTRRARDVVLTVSDDGPGVPDHERENIFSRFVRLDSSRSTPGHGLGLNLVAAVASAHRGSARALPTERGLAIELLLPAAPEPAAEAEAAAASSVG